MALRAASRVTVRVHRTGAVETFSSLSAARGAFLRAVEENPYSEVTLEGAAGRVLRRYESRAVAQRPEVFVPEPDPFTTAGAALESALARAWGLHREPTT